MIMEPSSDVRQVTTALYQFYIGLRQSGFNEEQAMYLLETYMTNSMLGEQEED